MVLGKILSKGTFNGSSMDRKDINYIRSIYDSEIKKSKRKLNDMRGTLSMKDFEKQLIQESRDNPDRKDEIYALLLMANMPLVFSMAERSAGQHQALRVSIEDIVSAGCCGFFRALDKFDMEKGKNVRLGNFALCYIRDCIKETIASLSPGITIPYYVFQQRRIYSNVDENVADEKTKRHKQYYEGLYRRCMSFAEKGENEDDDMDSGMLVAGAASAGISKKIERNEEQEIISCALRNILTEQEFEAVKMRFGLCGTDILSVQEIGKKMKLSAKDLREVISGALVKLYKDSKVRNLAESSGFLV